MSDDQAAVEVPSEMVAAWAEYERARTDMRAARARVHQVMRRVMAGGVSAYRLHKYTGMSEAHIGRLRRKLVERTTDEGN